MKRKILIAALLLALCTRVASQELPDAPSHRFLDKTNIALHSANVVAEIMDARTTQRFQQAPYYKNEANPIARPLVTRGWPGQIAYTTLSTGGVLLTSYIAHKTGHHKIERAIPVFFALTTGACVGWNYYVMNTHKQ